MFTSLAALLTGIWMVVEHHKLPDANLTLLLGIAVAILAFVELILASRPYWHRAP